MCKTVAVADLVNEDRVYWFKKDTHDYDWNSWRIMEAEFMKGATNLQEWKIYGVIRKGLFHYVE